MASDLRDRTGRTWADLFFLLPKYIIVVLFSLIVIMILRAEFANGITKYGFLGDWGKVPAASPSADDAIIGANVRLNRQLRCAGLSMDGIPARINDWKQYMEATAETSSNSSLRQSRTATWKSDVDDVLRQIQTVQQYLSGKRDSC